MTFYCPDDDPAEALEKGRIVVEVLLNESFGDFCPQSVERSS
jgi:hypothetical protein